MEFGETTPTLLLTFGQFPISRLLVLWEVVTTDEIKRKECSRYVANLFAAEDEVLKDLRREMAELDMPDIYIDAEEGRLLQVLLKAIGARRVVELGTLGGYSAIWMARALPADGWLVARWSARLSTTTSTPTSPSERK